MKSNENRDRFIAPFFNEIESSFFPFLRLPEENLQTKKNLIFEIIRSTFAFILLLPVRIVALFILLASAYWVCRLSAVLNLISHRIDRKDVKDRIQMWRVCVMKSMKVLAKLILLCLMIKVKRKVLADDDGSKQKIENLPCILVSNHLSYLDILILLSVFGECSFVARYTVLNVPFLGVMAKEMGVVFTGNGTKQTDSIISQSKQSIRGQRFFAIFPEGTTTNGRAMIRFRTGIFRSQLPVRPIVIKYRNRNFSPTWESIQLWYHILRLLTQFTTCCEIFVFPLMNPSQKEKDAPRLFADRVQGKMNELLGQPVYLLNRKHKMVFHSFLMGKIGKNEALCEAKQISLEDLSLHFQ